MADIKHFVNVSLVHTENQAKEHLLSKHYHSSSYKKPALFRLSRNKWRQKRDYNSPIKEILEGLDVRGNQGKVFHWPERVWVILLQTMTKRVKGKTKFHS